MSVLAQAERTLLIERTHPAFPAGCGARVHAALVRSDIMRWPQSYRFLDADGGEVTRSGLPLRDFDLEHLFDAGAPDDFVRDGRFGALLTALAREDAFVDRNACAPVIDNREAYAVWRAAPWPAAAQTVIDAMLAHPTRRLSGWQPVMGRLARTRDGRAWASPFYFLADAARELIHDGLLIGFLTRTDTYNFAPSRVGQVMLDGPSSVVSAFSEEGALLGRTTLGGLAFGSGLLTAFEARRVSWAALRRVAAAWRTRFRVDWYAPDADPESRGGEHLLDFEGFERAPSPSEAAANWLAQVGARKLTPDAIPLPDFDVSAIASPNGQLVARMVRAFWLGDDADLEASMVASAALNAEGPMTVAKALAAADRGERELGYLHDTADRRAHLIARWRSA